MALWVKELDSVELQSFDNITGIESCSKRAMQVWRIIDMAQDYPSC
ncbi:hypothetical protein YpsIP31758_1988 [Yersinia pseudotuberculosis IP 31758]|uniref:Uncharacterized protein n=1 Tax=Yersinia pseudotuberculosis serotype O:1b (strain IP 31758) TaxID=349747 RepID=A0A0U1QY41_YERP3|nr:hypothetical protein YpsIP31758_1988 [Yersinia pseudotuberculosis IP 31758]